MEGCWFRAKERELDWAVEVGASALVEVAWSRLSVMNDQVPSKKLQNEDLILPFSE